MLPSGRCAALVVGSLFAAAAARGEVQLKFAGAIASDLRYRLAGEEVPPPNTPAPFPTQQRLLRYGISRNENLIKAQLSVAAGTRVKAVGDVDFYWYGYSDVRDIDSETLRERVDPYRLEANAAYLDIYRILPGLDLRIGRQVVVWGTGDKFNPTSNLSTLDLSDPLLFGKSIGNQMVRLDYNPRGDLIFTAVWVPIFRPSQLPRTAPLGVTEPDRPAPVQDQRVRDQLTTLRAILPPSQLNVYGLLPPPSLDNSQLGLRVKARLWGLDLSVSYYHGRFGIPVPAWGINRPEGVVDTLVIWPRQDVVGFDLAGSLAALHGLGYWAEVALTFPQEVTFGLYNDAFGGHDPVTFRCAQTCALQFGFPLASRPLVVPSTPFWKGTFGIDYSWTKQLYSNLQYVHGFLDEFGAGKVARLPSTPGGVSRVDSVIGEYVVLGSDLKLFSDQLLFRLFGAFRLPTPGDSSYAFTGVLFPQLIWTVWDATELTVGAFLFLGDRSTKFGDPVVGASELFVKAKFSF